MATNSRGEAARAALIASAERLFAERGIDGVSLRDVSAAAGQRNHSAAQYHFGDRRGLVAAVWDNRMKVVDDRRRVYLAQLDVDGRDGVIALVEALVVPLVQVVAETDGWYGRFLARSRWDPSAWQGIGTERSSSFAKALARLERQLDDVPRRVRRHRLDQMMTLLVGTLAGWEGAPARGERRLGVELLTRDLVTTSVALLTAPSLDLIGVRP